MPRAPEELIDAVANEITSEDVLANIAMSIGILPKFILNASFQA